MIFNNQICDACYYVRYGKDGGSTYCGRRKGCEFVPAEEGPKRKKKQYKLQECRDVPKYVLELLDRRVAAAEKLHDICSALDDYCTKIGIPPEAFDDAALCSSFLITTEPTVAKRKTLAAIQAQLQERAGEK